MRQGLCWDNFAFIWTQLVEVVMCNSVVLKEEVWERRPHTKWRRRLHQIVRIKWAFACNHFYTGSSCFTVDFWLAVRICMSLAHPRSLKCFNVIVYIRGGQSHFFRLRLCSCFKIFESGSGNFSNLRIRILFRLWLQSTIQP